MKSTRCTGISVIILLTVLSFSTAGRTGPQREGRPNVVLIYLDDMGYGDLSLTGALGYKTPNIDNIAHKGMFFTRFYSPQAVCTASRAGLLTGCYPNRVGLSGALSPSSSVGLSAGEETIAEMLKKQGYATAAFGKWHLGFQRQFLPTRHGFDEYYGIPYSSDMWPHHPTGTYPPLPVFQNDTIVDFDVTPEEQSQFITDFTTRTIDFIRRKQDHPFFVYLAHATPHVPLYVSEKFKGKSGQGLYGDVMMEIDWGVGQIMKALEETGLDRNTLLIFTSDNGPWINYGNHAGSTAGYREGKGTTYEGGQRVPCLMMWKGVIPAGAVCNKLASGIDIFPTLSAITGTPLPKNKIDGVSLLPLLQGDEQANPRESFYYYYRKNSLEAVTNGTWKLVFPHPGRTYLQSPPGADGSPGVVNENFPFDGGLYDLRRDPGERYDVRDSHPEIVKALEQIADRARADLGDDLTGHPGKNRRPAGMVAKGSGEGRTVK